MDDIDWLSLFNRVCSNKAGLLRWSLPEPWVQAELYSQLCDSKSGWHPINHEIPYVTYFPVVPPSNRDLASQGAIKWIDMALVSEGRKQWCWFELKVRPTGNAHRRETSEKAALSAIKRDVTALIGMDIVRTSETWVSPDEYTASHWFDEVLSPRVESIGQYSHSYVMAYLQLFGEIEGDRFLPQEITRQVEKWVQKKNKKAEKTIVCPKLTIDVHSKQVAGQHSLVIVRWDV